MKRKGVVSALLAAVLLAAACAHAPAIVPADQITTPQKAQKALTEAQLDRVAVRNSVAQAYVTAQKSGDANLIAKAEAARTAARPFDARFTISWHTAADAADAWLAAPADQSAAATFKTIYDAVVASLNGMKGATP